MKNLERLDEALDLLVDGDLLNRISRHNADEFVAAVAAVCDAARLLANGERVKPDYARADAAFRIALATKGIEVDGLPTAQVSRAIVDAAIGGRLLVDPPKEER